jgi:hypothetical protein
MENRAKKIERELATGAVWEEVFDGINHPCAMFVHPEEVKAYIQAERPDLVSDLVDWEGVSERVMEIIDMWEENWD